MPSTRSLSSPGVVCQEAFSSAETLSPPKILHIHGGILPLRMVQCLQTDTEQGVPVPHQQQRLYTPRETLNTYAYRPGIVLDGVGDIPALARNEKR